MCYASRGEDGEGDGALGVGANKGFRPHWQAGPAVIDFTLILASTYKNTLIYVFGADSSLLTKRITVHANSLLMQVYNVRPSE